MGGPDVKGQVLFPACDRTMGAEVPFCQLKFSLAVPFQLSLQTPMSAISCVFSLLSNRTGVKFYWVPADLPTSSL